MIDRDGLYERGSMSRGIGWQIPRLPGLGDADWGEIFGDLYRVGLRRRLHHRARGSPVRGDRPADQARLPAGARHPAALHPEGLDDGRLPRDGSRTAAALTDDPRAMRTVRPLTYRDVAKTIDHSLLRPELDDAFIDENAAGSPAQYDVASVTCRPADVQRAARRCDGHGRRGGHGRWLSARRPPDRDKGVRDASAHSSRAPREIDMVIQIGALQVGPRRGRRGGHPCRC